MRLVFSSSDGRAFGSLSSRSLRLLHALYLDNQEVVDTLVRESAKVPFPGGAPGGLPLTRAKVLDMYGFELGYRPDKPEAEDTSSS